MRFGNFMKLVTKYLLPVFGSTLFATTFFVYQHRLYHFENLNIPISYDWDSLYILTSIKSYMDGSFSIFGSKINPYLNYPNGGNWNDFPSNQDLIFNVFGLIARVVGLSCASWLFLLLAHLSNLWAFVYVGRKFKLDNLLINILGILFAFSPFIFARGLGHIALSLYYSVPLIIYIIINIIENTSVKMNTIIILSFLISLSFIYYIYIFEFILLVLLFVKLAKQNMDSVKTCLKFQSLTILLLLIYNFDSFYFWINNGFNQSAVSRNLDSYILYGLRLPDLILPIDSKIEFLNQFAKKVYYNNTNLIQYKTEQSYLGIIGIVGLWLSIFFLLRNEKVKNSFVLHNLSRINLGILGYSLVGGINLLIGALGFQLIRCSNRFSIFLLCSSLLIFGVCINKLFRSKRLIFFLILALLGFCFWEQAPRRTSKSINLQILNKVNEDKEIALIIEKTNNPAVLMIPIVEFPESPPINNMQDYDQFRPYLFSKTARFSYGTNKGRNDSVWSTIDTQCDIKKKINDYKVSHILINRSAFKDNGVSMLSDLTKNIENPKNSLIIFKNPSWILVSLN